MTIVDQAGGQVFTLASERRQLPNDFLSRQQESGKEKREPRLSGQVFGWLTPRSTSRTSEAALRVPSCFPSTNDLTTSLVRTSPPPDGVALPHDAYFWSNL